MRPQPLKRGSIYHSMLQLLRDFDYWPLNRWPLNREEKSLRHVAMVAKFLDDNKPIKSLKSLFALFQTSPILFNFI